MNRRALLGGFLSLPVAARFERPREMTDAERAETVAVLMAWQEEQLRAGLAAMLGAYRKAADENARQWYEAMAGHAVPMPDPFGRE